MFPLKLAGQTKMGRMERRKIRKTEKQKDGWSRVTRNALFAMRRGHRNMKVLSLKINCMVTKRQIHNYPISYKRVV